MKKLILASLLLTSCGYHWSSPVDTQLSIPFVAGDEEGNLTTELIRTFAANGMRVVQAEKANYRLEVSLSPITTEWIGYRLDRQKIKGAINKNMVGIESRRIRGATVSLVNLSTGEVEIGPMQINAEIDYDFYDGDSSEELSFVTPKGTPHTVLSFSLGQLESPESAGDAAMRPLNRRLSQLIVESIRGALAWR